MWRARTRCFRQTIVKFGRAKYEFCLSSYFLNVYFFPTCFIFSFSTFLSTYYIFFIPTSLFILSSFLPTWPECRHEEFPTCHLSPGTNSHGSRHVKRNDRAAIWNCWVKTVMASNYFWLFRNACFFIISELRHKIPEYFLEKTTWIQGDMNRYVHIYVDIYKAFYCKTV